jgi:hypothetical protein
MREQPQRINYESEGLEFDHLRVSALPGESHFRGAPRKRG